MMIQPPSCSVLVQHITGAVTQDHLVELFETFGRIERIQVHPSQATDSQSTAAPTQERQCRIDFADAQSAQAAVMMSGMQLGDKPLLISMILEQTTEQQTMQHSIPPPPVAPVALSPAVAAAQAAAAALTNALRAKSASQMSMARSIPPAQFAAAQFPSPTPPRHFVPIDATAAQTSGNSFAVVPQVQSVAPTSAPPVIQSQFHSFPGPNAAATQATLVAPIDAQAGSSNTPFVPPVSAASTAAAASLAQVNNQENAVALDDAAPNSRALLNAQTRGSRMNGNHTLSPQVEVDASPSNKISAENQQSPASTMQTQASSDTDEKMSPAVSQSATTKPQVDTSSSVALASVPSPLRSSDASASVTPNAVLSAEPKQANASPKPTFSQPMTVGQRRQEQLSRTIVCGNVLPTLTEQQLWGMLQKLNLGEFVALRFVPTAGQPAQSALHYMFVEFKQAADAQKALQTLAQHELIPARPLTVAKARNPIAAKTAYRGVANEAAAKDTSAAAMNIIAAAATAARATNSATASAAAPIVDQVALSIHIAKQAKAAALREKLRADNPLHRAQAMQAASSHAGASPLDRRSASRSRSRSVSRSRSPARRVQDCRESSRDSRRSRSRLPDSPDASFARERIESSRASSRRYEAEPGRSRSKSYYRSHSRSPSHSRRNSHRSQDRYDDHYSSRHRHEDRQQQQQQQQQQHYSHSQSRRQHEVERYESHHSSSRHYDHRSSSRRRDDDRDFSHADHIHSRHRQPEAGRDRRAQDSKPGSTSTASVGHTVMSRTELHSSFKSGMIFDGFRWTQPPQAE